jgi:formylmethanofuran dehydrogenase subunit E
MDKKRNVTPLKERCAVCGEQTFTRDHLVEGEVLPLCQTCADANLHARPCGDDGPLLLDGSE